jgi:hypothetical protein
MNSLESVETSGADASSSEDALAPGDASVHQAHKRSGLLERQLAAARLDRVATKVAAGLELELDDAVALSRASLPLLGRISQVRARSTGFSRNSDEQPPTTAAQRGPGGTASANLPIQNVASLADLPRPIAQPLTDWEAFCRRLLEFRCQAYAACEPVAWHPEVSRLPDEEGSLHDRFTGVDLLRAIALARLLLPANVQIVAPLATLGPKLAQVALEFGATHLGYLATDGNEFESPMLVSRSVLDELRGSCSRTMLREG